MEKVNKLKLIEVITDIVTLQVSETEEKWMRDVRFNGQLQGVSIRTLKFDKKKFYIEEYEPEQRKKYIENKKKEEEKLNRPKTKEEESQDLEELLKIPTLLQEIKVVYRKSPTEDIIDMVSYINQIIDA